MAFKLVDDSDNEKPKGRYRLLQEDEAEEPGVLKQTAYGIGQGALDVATMATAPLSIPQWAIQKALGIRGDTREIKEREHDQPRISQELETLGKLEQGQKPSLAELMTLGEEANEPVPRASLRTPYEAIGNIEELIPKTGQYQETVRRGTRNLPFLAAGPAAYATLTGGDIAGQYAGAGAKALGATEGESALIDIGVSTLSGFGLNRWLDAGKEIIPAVASQEGGLFAKAEIQASPSSFQKRIQTFENSQINQLEQNVDKVSKKTLSDFPEMDASKASTEILEGNKNALLDQVHPSALSTKEAFTNTQKTIENLYSNEKIIYRDLYSQASRLAKDVEAHPEKSINLALESLDRLTSIETQAPGYASVEKALRSALSDLGYIKTEPGHIARVATDADKLTRVAVSLSDIVNYESLSPSIKDILKPLVRQIKKDAREALREGSPGAERIFDKAEKAYASTAKKFGNDAVIAVRKSTTPETLGSGLLKPSNLESVKNALTGAPKAIAQVERQIINELSRMEANAANRVLNELRPYMSPKSYNTGKDVVRIGDKMTGPGQAALTKVRALQDVQEAAINGTRPDFTLKAMQTPEGYRLVKSAFARSPKGKMLFNALKKQYVADITDSILTKEGTIDWNKAANILLDPHTSMILEEAVGKDGLIFYRNLGKYAQRISSNLERYSKQAPNVVERLFNGSTPISKGLMAVLVNSIGGHVPAAAYVGYQASKSALMKLLSNPSVQGTIKSIANKENIGKQDVMLLLNQLNKL